MHRGNFINNRQRGVKEFFIPRSGNVHWLKYLIFTLFCITLSGFPPYTDTNQSTTDKFDPSLIRMFREKAPASQDAAPSILSKSPGADNGIIFIVYLKSSPLLKPSEGDTKTRRQAVVNALRQKAQISQEPLLTLLNDLKKSGLVTGYESFFASNAVAVRGTLKAAMEIARLESVRRICPNYPVRIEGGLHGKRTGRDTGTDRDMDARISAYNWNIDVIDAERVWSEFGVYGEGIVIASIGPGVDWTHLALKSSYRGWNGSSARHNYNWFDFDGELHGEDYGQSRTYEPSDSGDLGTFTMGCAVGDGGTMNTHIGVAPGAKWIAVTPNGLQTNGIYADDIMMHKCFQWMLAPTDLSGDASSADPARAPDVVFCAFSTLNPLDETFRDNIKALKAAGIFVVAPAGDVGSAPAGVASPGSLPEVFATGAVNKWGEIYEKSGHGPSPWDEIKPDACAPGVDVYGCVPGGVYEGGFTGTAIAAAHIAGVYALLKSAEPILRPDILDQTLRISCTDLGVPGPDNTFGWGYVNAYRGVSILRAGGKLAGIVTRSDNAQPIEDITVKAVNTTAPYDTLTTTTRADGSFAFPLAPGVYDITFTSLFFETKTLPGIVVRNGICSKASISLVPKTTYLLSGRVLDAKYGIPILGTVTIQETGMEYVTGHTGEYSFQLPAGTYNLKVVASAHRSAHMSIPLSGDRTEDFRLPRAPNILIVDAEASFGWDEGWKVISYYERALEAADYSYDALSINASWELPTPADLRAYDVVIWAQANRGYTSIGAEALLKSHLIGGGKLLLCGQDIGPYDGSTDFYTNYLKAQYIKDDASADGACGANTLSGVSVSFGGEGTSIRPKGAPAAFIPDVIASTDISAIPCLYYAGGKVAGLQINPCQSPRYRAIYLAVGIESITPGDMLSSALDKAITWLNGGGESYDVWVSPGESYGSGEIGRSYIYYQTITNMGALSDTFDLSISQNTWQTTIWNQDLSQQISNTGTLSPCEETVVAVKVSAPADTPQMGYDTAIFTATSRGNGNVKAIVPLKTYAFVNWSIEASMLTPRYRQVSVADDNCAVYVIGGLDWASGEAFSLNECYDTRNGTWSLCAPKPTAAGNCGSALLNGKIYVAGGYNLSLLPPRLSAVEVYDPLEDTWELKTNLPYFASGVACAAYDGKLYTFGGFDGSKDCDSAWAYDPSEDRWTALSPMPGGGRSNTRTAVLNDKIYILGGWPNLHCVECYDPATDTWETKTPMHQGRHSFGCEAADGYIYVFGGGSAWVGMAEAERYNPDTDTWEWIYSMNDARRAGVSSALTGGKLYAFGGISDTPATAVEILPIRSTLTPSTISVSANAASHNDTLFYEIHLRYGGFLPLPNVSLTNPLSPYVSYIADSATGGLTYHTASHELRWSGDLTSNEDKYMTFRVKITDDPYPGVVIKDIMEITGDSCGTLQRSTATTITGPLLIESTKSVDKEFASPGDILTYTISLVNTSTKYDALNLNLLDPIPEHLTYVAGSITGGASYNAGENRIEWTGNLLKSIQGGFNPEYEDSDTGSITYNWIDASTLAPLEGDDIGIVLPIGFTFTYFGVPYIQVGVSTNGYLSFDTNLAAYENQCLPDSTAPNAIIAPFWDDLKIARMAGDGVWYDNYGEAPNRKFVIRWRAHDIEDTENQDPPYEFEAILYEKEGDALFQYKSMTAPKGNGSSASAGIESASGGQSPNLGKSYICNGAPSENQIHNDLAVLFTHIQPPFFDRKILTFQATVENDPAACDWLIENTAALNFEGYTINILASTRVNSTPLTDTTYTVDKSTCRPKDKVIFTLMIRNSGNFFADVTARCPIPQNTTFVRIIKWGTYDPGENRVEWSDLAAPGVPQEVSFEVEVNDTAPDGSFITSTADVSAKCAPEPVYPTASSLVESYILDQSSFTSDHTQAAPGNTITYILELINTGAAPVSPLAYSTLPQEITMVAGSWFATSGTFAYDAQFRKIIWSGPLPAKTSIMCYFSAKVKQSVPPGTNLIVTFDITHPYGSLTRSTSTYIRTPYSASWMFY